MTEEDIMTSKAAMLFAAYCAVRAAEHFARLFFILAIAFFQLAWWFYKMVSETREKNLRMLK
jgi:flagellar biogenesis protein FliO